MTFHIRNYRNTNYADVNEVWLKTDMGGDHRGDNAKMIEDSIANNGALFCLFNNKDKLIGTAWITNDTRRLYLHHFGILPEYQGQKLSHLLMEKVMEFAKKMNMQIKLEVHKSNIIANKLYNEYGFKYLGDYKVLIVRNVNK